MGKTGYLVFTPLAWHLLYFRMMKFLLHVLLLLALGNFPSLMAEESSSSEEVLRERIEILGRDISEAMKNYGEGDDLQERIRAHIQLERENRAIGNELVAKSILKVPLWKWWSHTKALENHLKKTEEIDKISIALREEQEEAVRRSVETVEDLLEERVDCLMDLANLLDGEGRFEEADAFRMEAHRQVGYYGLDR